MCEMTEYEKQCEQRKKDNEVYLEWFKQDLEEKGLKPKTLTLHTTEVVGFLLQRPLHCPKRFSLTWSPQA